MSTLDVVAEILREVAPRALKARQIAELAGARLPTASRTPETVVSRDLAIDVRDNGASSRFLRVGAGAFLLKEVLPTALYSDIDPYASAWTRNLVSAGQIAPGVVDERSIRDLKPADVASYRQFHAFSGIGIWSRALRDAGWPDDSHVWSGSCPCFPAGTLILTQRGNLPIEDVCVGDIVLTHRARWQRVTQVGSEVSKCVELKGQGHWGLVCTPAHPFLSGDEEWTHAGEMIGKRWSTVAQVPSFMEVPPLDTDRGAFYDKYSKGFRATGFKDGKSVYLGLYQTKQEAQERRDTAARAGEIDVRGADAVDTASLGFARFLGYWIGDGWTTGEFVCLCGAKEDTDFLKSLMKSAGLSASMSLERTSSRARCGSKALVAWLRLHFGQGAANKRLPAWLHATSSEYRQAFLSGYFAADGHQESRRRSGASIFCFTTVSRALAIGTRILLNQAGISASVSFTSKRAGKAVIEGRVVHTLPIYRVTAYDKARSFQFNALHGRGLVRSVTGSGEARVYNLAVEGDESYCADGIVVHNCTPFSSAGRKRGFSDEQHLWPEWFRLIRECGPSVVVGEQVASKDGYRWLDEVARDFEGVGYNFTATELSAAAVGAPHRRQRIYFVAFLGQRLDNILPRVSLRNVEATPSGTGLHALHARMEDEADARGAGSARDLVDVETTQAADDVMAYTRERGREILSSSRLHDRGQPRHDAPRRGEVDGGDTVAVSDSASARPCIAQDARADRGDAITRAETIDRGTAGDLELERGRADDGSGAVSDAECVMRDAWRAPLAHGRSEIEPDRHGEVDGARVGEGDGAGCCCVWSVGLGDASLARGGRDAGTVPRAEGLGEGERIETGDLADEPVAPGAADGADSEIGMVRGATDVASDGSDAAFRPGDRIRIDGDPGWGGAVRGYWAQDVEWIYCRPEPGHKDGRWRPAKSGNEPLVNGLTADLGRTRAARLRCFGNAIVLPQAIAFIEAIIDAFVDARQALDESREDHHDSRRATEVVG